MDISESISIFLDLLFSCFSYCYSLLSDIKVFNGISLFSIVIGSLIFSCLIPLLFSIPHTVSVHKDRQLRRGYYKEGSAYYASGTQYHQSGTQYYNSRTK